MPARVVIVHDDLATLHSLADALALAGQDVGRFNDAHDAWHALGKARRIELLITLIRFGPGKPHGLALLLRTRRNRPEVKVIFTGPPQSRHAVQHFGPFLPMPVDVPKAVATVERILA
jgi:DNA-binding NtrC family response regulator